jgi:predicted nucleic acid-binding protein
MMVIDASALVDLIMRWRSAPIVVRLAQHQNAHVPVTIDAEVLHALRKHAFSGAVDPEHIEAALKLLNSPILVRHPVKTLARRIWSLRHNITTYDAAYVALAESLGFPLLTREARLSRSSGHAATIEYID